jgi:predicted nucleotidyltransferase
MALILLFCLVARAHRGRATSEYVQILIENELQKSCTFTHTYTHTHIHTHAHTFTDRSALVGKGKAQMERLADKRLVHVHSHTHIQVSNDSKREVQMERYTINS